MSFWENIIGSSMITSMIHFSTMNNNFDLNIYNRVNIVYMVYLLLDIIVDNN